MNAPGHLKISMAVAGLVLLAVTGCRKSVPTGALVLTQSPATMLMAPATDALDSNYPSGSRVVLLERPGEPQRVQVLSEGLTAAGSPVVSYDGRRVFFAGKSEDRAEWQIFKREFAGGSPQKFTSMPGGAMSPVLLPDGRLVFVSPVPKAGGANSARPPSALYVQSPGGLPLRLTFSPGSVTDPTMLDDGRILFVSIPPPDASNSAAGPALFTINNDGTELTAFTAAVAPGSFIHRPRPIATDRVVYLLSQAASDTRGALAEFVRMARPFQSRAPLFPEAAVRLRSLESAGNGDLLVCAETPSSLLALFRVDATATGLGTPLLLDPHWNICDAVEAAPRPPPMGRLSTTDPTKSTGKILCLNANFSGDIAPDGTPTAARIRVLAELAPGSVSALGEVPVQADGSFLAEVPADVPLGFEALDEAGRVLRRQAPMLWVRPAENRSCVGCHEPHNRSPHNRRPLAVSAPIAFLGLNSAETASRKAK